MIKLLEDKLELMVRETEVELAESLISECEQEYSEIMKSETGDDYNTTLTIIEDRFLTN